MTDPRAALAEAVRLWNEAGIPVTTTLAERGVLLVTADMLAAAYERVADGPVLDSDAQVGAAIFAALTSASPEAEGLSGEVTE